MNQQLGRPVIELVGHHCADKAELIGDARQMREPIAYPGARFAMLFERKLRPQQLRHAADEGEAFAGDELLRAVLTVAADVDIETLQQLAVNDARVAKFIDGNTVKRIIVTPTKLVNIIIG